MIHQRQQFGGPGSTTGFRLPEIAEEIVNHWGKSPFPQPLFTAADVEAVAASCPSQEKVAVTPPPPPTRPCPVLMIGGVAYEVGMADWGQYERTTERRHQRSAHGCFSDCEGCMNVRHRISFNLADMHRILADPRVKFEFHPVSISSAGAPALELRFTHVPMPERPPHTYVLKHMPNFIVRVMPGALRPGQGPGRRNRPRGGKGRAKPSPAQASAPQGAAAGASASE